MENTNSAVQVSTAKNPAIQSHINKAQEEEDFDYSQRSQWLRAAVLGANDGLVSIASLMMGIGAVKTDAKAMILTGFAGLVAGASSMAIGEFVSVYSQLEIEVAQIKREAKTQSGDVENGNVDEGGSKKEKLPNPLIAAMASALAFALGAMVPLLAAAFIGNHKDRMISTVAAVSFALVAFGWVGAKLGNTSIVRSCGRVLVGGWLAMAITFGLTKSISASGLG
ncbi:OLC1v1002552C1 [Oldenlandia corymbosa var. corymbosa]|uniref:Vacuolar iron transporter n=1 Tax=Oldenlandia corymbosa var. corymbosa TaxID=529605 RepID=A0AAV1D831_OLDCO|nr:OLC1v1002552C1 [Oldenlandia corymbosa var. corymbosa]